MDLFDFAESERVKGRQSFVYPSAPGHKEIGGASQGAADDIKPRASILRDRCLQALSRRPMTADEVAAAIGEDILSVRPRITELHRMGLAFKTDARRPSSNGKPQTVWSI